MSSADNWSNTLLADSSWRRRHSAWLLAVVLGFGLLSFIGFVYCALRIRNRRWWIIAASASLASAVMWVVTSFEDSTGEITDWAAGVGLAITAGMIVAGVILNREYLRWRAGQTGPQAWYNQPVAGPAQSFMSPHPGQQSPGGVLGIQQSDYYAPTPAPTPAPPPVTAADRATTVDINHASSANLMSALGIDDALAARIVESRSIKGGFRDLDDLVTTASLQPHQMVKLRDKVTFGPFQPSDAPQPGFDQRGGRILDF